MWWKCSPSDFTRVWNPLTCWVWKGVLKQCFLENNLSKSFTACKFRKKKPMSIIFFFKMFKIWCRLGTTNSLNLKKDISYWQSMCYETSLIFNMSLREIFFKSSSIRVMEKYDGSALMTIYQRFETL